MATYLKLLVVFFLSVSFLASLRPGVDGEKYVRWAKACLGANIDSLESDEIGPLGVPVYHWFAGTGLLLCPFFLVMNPVGLPDSIVLEVGGAFYAILFWILLCQSIREAFHRNDLAIFGMLVAFVGTPLGYYSRSISSETFTLFPIGVLLLQTVRFAKGQRPSWAAVAGSTGLLLIVRPYLAAYAWPILCTGIASEFKDLFSSHGSRKRCAIAISLSLSCILLALSQVFMVQFWMTGSPTTSPYLVGDQEFQALTLTAPPFVENVLFDTFHGVLTAHPLVGLGLLINVYLAIRSAYRRQFLIASIWAITVAVVATNIWIQGSFYYWWNSESSFANRCVILPSIPALLGVLVLLAERRSNPWFLTSIVGFCCLWSYLQLMQGPTNYTSWYYFLDAQWGQLMESRNRIDVTIALSLLILATIAYRPAGPLQLLSIALVAALSVYLYRRAELNPGRISMLTFVSLPTAAAVLLSTRELRNKNGVARLVLNRMIYLWSKLLSNGDAISTFSMVSFCVAIACFLPLAVSTTQSLQPTDIRPRIDAVGLALDEMEFYSEGRADFSADAKRMREFLQRMGCKPGPPKKSVVPTFLLLKERRKFDRRYL